MSSISSNLSTFSRIFESGLGRKDLAFEWLEKAFAQREASLTFMKTDETLANLQEDPRFYDLLSRMKK